MSETKETGKNLIQKVVDVMESMGNIEKRGVFKAYGTEYNYITHDDIASKLQEALVKSGVLIIPHVLSVEQKEIESKSGAKGTHTYLNMKFQITDGVESIEVPWHSEAQDWNDKGIGKAITYAKKYFVINLLQIATGDPKDDSDSSVDKGEEVIKNPKGQQVAKPVAKPVVRQTTISEQQPTVDTITKEQYDAYEALAVEALELGYKAPVIDMRLEAVAYDKVYKMLEDKVAEARKGK